MKRKTKIVCTVGPAIDNEVMLEKMFEAGMNVARLNFSHANYEEHGARIKMIREVAKRTNKFIGIMTDTKGPEIRTGVFEDGKVFFNKGDEVSLVKEEVVGNKERFHIACPELFDDIEVGHYLLIDDGKMRLDVVGVSEGEIKAVVKNSGPIKSRKGVNVPNVKLSMPFVSEKDRADLIFSCEMGVDLVAASFVRRPEDIMELREILDSHNGKNVEIIAKIENQEGFNNLEEILKVADGVMVARGDLGVEVNTEYVPIYQKKIIAKANELGKPVITATHMLETMMTNPRPTRAEASDVANAILDGTDAIMLSGESAAGEYPVESVQTMNRIAETIEEIFPYADRLQKSIQSSQATINDAIGIATSQSALTLKNVEAVIAFTETGGTAKRICKFRPNVPIIAITDNIATCRKLSYYWGVTSVIRDTVTDISQFNPIANEVAKEFGIKPGQTIIITSGWGQQHGSTNNMRIIEVK
ncbi:MAG: pyruvate kinase [Bacilli bacterium]|nr:pyruvate kinase [Bacilli bacterium]